MRGFHPCAAIEDVAAGCTWGVQVCWDGSWQIGEARKGDDIADHERGHRRPEFRPWTRRARRRG